MYRRGINISITVVAINLYETKNKQKLSHNGNISPKGGSLNE